jgi:hypothetical protein
MKKLTSLFSPSTRTRSKTKTLFPFEHSNQFFINFKSSKAFSAITRKLPFSLENSYKHRDLFAKFLHYSLCRFLGQKVISYSSLQCVPDFGCKQSICNFPTREVTPSLALIRSSAFLFSLYFSI